MGERRLFELLESFENYRFIQLRYELGLSASQVPLGDTPQVTAERFISFIRLRDDGDLMKLEEAVVAVIGRSTRPASRSTAPSPGPPLPPRPAPKSGGPVVPAIGDRRPRLLVLAANPKATARLKLEEEAAAIAAALGEEGGNRRYQVTTVEAVQAGACTKLLLDNRPRILHFSGHGNPDGSLRFLDGVGLPQPVAPTALAAWFAAVPDEARPDCVVLSACYTNETARCSWRPSSASWECRRRSKTTRPSRLPPVSTGAWRTSRTITPPRFGSAVQRSTFWECPMRPSRLSRRALGQGPSKPRRRAGRQPRHTGHGETRGCHRNRNAGLYPLVWHQPAAGRHAAGKARLQQPPRPRASRRPVRGPHPQVPSIRVRRVELVDQVLEGR